MNNYSCRVWVEGIDNPVDVVIKADSVKHLQAELKSASQGSSLTKMMMEQLIFTH